MSIKTQIDPDEMYFDFEAKLRDAGMKELKACFISVLLLLQSAMSVRGVVDYGRPNHRVVCCSLQFCCTHSTPC